MAYGVVHRFPGATEQQYLASVAAVHPSDGSLPEGQLYHAAGPSEDGWMIVAIHESRANWERFRDEVLMPRMQAGIAGGFTSPPEETTFEVAHHDVAHNVHTVIRTYDGDGADELFEALATREDEIRDVIATVPGFVSYTALRTGSGGTTVTVCEDKAGTDESSKRAAAWVQQNIPVSVTAPAVTEGEAVLHF